LGGYGNSAQLDNSVVIGGQLNLANGQLASVIAGQLNTANSTYATVVGGNSNTASSSNAAVVGGSSNNAGGQSATILGGASNTANGTQAAILGGAGNTANQNGAAVIAGTNNVANGQNSVVVGGDQNASNSLNSVVVGGAYGSARSIIGNLIFPASNAPVDTGAGRQQLATLLLGRITTDATATVLRSNSSAAGTTNQVILPNNSAYTFQGTVIAARTAAGDTSSWKFEGVIKRGANAASTTLVAAVTPTVIAQDAGASTWVLAITADTTNGGIAVTVTGAAATTIRWVAKIETTEVTF
jgi:hypothetical protein